MHPTAEYDVVHHYVTRNPDIEPTFLKDQDPKEFPPQLPVNLADMYEDQTVRKSGVIVKDGQFDPVPTATAIYQCVLHAYRHNDPNKGNGTVDRCYIERMEFDGEKFKVQLGS